MRKVATLDAERAVARVNQTLALHFEFGGLNRSRRGRLAGTVGIVRADPGRYLALPHIVAAAEDFSHRLLLNLTEPLLPRSHQATRVIWKKAETEAEAAWDSHIRSWKDWHGVRLSEAPSYSALRAFIEARNAIMHGLGTLTRRQTRDDGGTSVRAQLAGVGIVTIGDQLIISDANVRRCADAMKAFVLWLDGEAERCHA